MSGKEKGKSGGKRAGRNPFALARNTWTIGAERTLSSVEQNHLKRREVCEYIFIVLLALASALYFLRNKDSSNFAVYNCILLFLLGSTYFVGFVWKNVSYVILQRLMSRAKIRIILVFCIVRFILDISTEPIPATYYVLGTLATLFIDAIEFKSRRIALVLALSIMLMNIFGYLVTVSDEFATVMGVEVSDGSATNFGLPKNYLTKKEVKTYIYWNMFTLTFGSLGHIIVDKDLQKLVFVYGRVFRPNLRYRQGSTNPVSCLDNKRWGAETGIILSICCCLILYVYDYSEKNKTNKNPLNENYVFFALFLTLAFIAMSCWCFLLWKNVSFSLLRRLFRQSSFVLVTSMCLYRMFIAFTRDESKKYGSIMTSVAYTFFNLIVVSLDAIEEKSRYFSIFCVLASVVINLFSIVSHIFYGAGLNGGEYETFMWGILKVRRERRKIYLTILTHTLGGLITILRDTNGIKLAFVKKRVYRRTGSTSKFIGRDKFLQMRERELSVEMGIEESTT